MSEQELMSGLKQIVLGHYTVLKDAYEEVKTELYEINKELAPYNKLLGMMKKPEDVYKKGVVNFYKREVLPVIIKTVDELTESIDEEEYKLQMEFLDTIVNSKVVGMAEIINLVKIRINQLNNKKEIIGSTNVYSEQISRIKNLLKSLDTNMFFEDEISYNNLIEYISESDIIDNTKKDLLDCITIKREEYLRKQEEKNKELELHKKRLEQQKLDNKKSNIKNNNPIIREVYNFSFEDFLDNDDLELIKNINKEIYLNSKILDNISEETISLINQSLEHKELELNIHSILKDYNISNYRNILILFEIKKLMKQIDQIFQYVKANKIKDNDLNKYKSEMLTYVSKIYKLYSNYTIEEKLEEQIEIKNQKHVIYIKNSSCEILLKNDIKNDPENYKYFIDMLNELQEGKITNNHQKDVRFTNNEKLSDVCKKKKNYARLVYCPYDDFYLVFAGFIKKNNKNNYELNLVKNRYSYYKIIIDETIKDLSDPEKREKIIEENDKIHEDLINYLKTNSRNKTKELIK